MIDILLAAVHLLGVLCGAFARGLAKRAHGGGVT